MAESLSDAVEKKRALGLFCAKRMHRWNFQLGGQILGQFADNRLEAFLHSLFYIQSECFDTYILIKACGHVMY